MEEGGGEQRLVCKITERKLINNVAKTLNSSADLKQVIKLCLN